MEHVYTYVLYNHYKVECDLNVTVWYKWYTCALMSQL